MKGVPFLKKMVYERVRGWTSGRSLPVLNFFEYSHPPPGGHKMCRHVDYIASKRRILTLDIDNAEKKTFGTASSEGCTFSTLEETALKIYDFLPFI